MVPEIWVRNPEYYVRECVEVGIYNFIWDEPYLYKKHLDPVAFANVWATGLPWRSLVVNDEVEVALETDHEGRTVEHFVWSYGSPITDLEALLERVAGTARMVVIMRIPHLRTGLGKKFMRLLGELQEDYPDSIMHIHALYSWAFLFGMEWQSVDIEPRTSARGGKIHIPNGKRVNHERASEMPEWVGVTGMRVRDLELPRNRCLFNLRSAQWAAKYYKEAPKFPTKFKPRGPFAAKTYSRRIFFHLVEPEDGDKLSCNTCSLANECRYYREGAICAVPGSEVADLAGYFNTRNAQAIIEGLGELLASQAIRLQRGMDIENEGVVVNEEGDREFEVSPAVTALFDKMFKNGERLAKLLDPSLTKPAVQVNVGQATPPTGTQLTGANRAKITAAIIGELEAQGYERSEITPDMITDLLEKKAQQAALNAGG